MNLARMYSLRGCPNCDAIRVFFQQHQIEFEDIEIGDDIVLHNGIKSMTNGQLMAPVVHLSITNDWVVGYQQDRLEVFANAVAALRGSSTVPSNVTA